MRKILGSDTNKRMRVLDLETFATVKRGESAFVMGLFTDVNYLDSESNVHQTTPPKGSGTTTEKPNRAKKVLTEEDLQKGAFKFEETGVSSPARDADDGVEAGGGLSPDDFAEPGSPEDADAALRDKGGSNGHTRNGQPLISEEEMAALHDVSYEATVPVSEMEEKIEEAKKEAFEEGKQAGFDEGVRQGKTEAEAEAKKTYQAQKDDYLDSLKKVHEDARAELAKVQEFVNRIDEQVPELVLGWVKSIIGVERKVNDDLAANVISGQLSRIHDLEEVTFVVNPDDVESVKEVHGDYPVVGDPAIKKGGVKVRSKIGTVDFTVEHLVADLEKAIYEKLTASEES